MIDPPDQQPLWDRLILVSGHRRSGTTWLASALGKAEGIQQIPNEPLWLKWHAESPYNDRIREWRSRPTWQIGWQGTPQDEQDARMLRGHLDWLCRHYFTGPVGTLIVKEPHPNWLSFLVHAFCPDLLIYLERHPIGIVNSYDKGSLYAHWHVDEEWQAFCRDLPAIEASLVPLARFARHPAERVAFIVHVSNLIGRRMLAAVPGRTVVYENLGLHHQEGFEDLYRWLGFTWDDATWERLRPIITPRASEAEQGFRFVKKQSEKRVYAWRTEMAPHLTRRLARLLDRLGGGYPAPGASLPPLTAEEMLAGWKTFFGRRKFTLKNYGLRAALESL